MIPYGKQHIGPEDIRAVVSALKSSRITQGPLVDRFEAALASFCGVRHAIAVSSGTAALHLACLAAGIKKGDEVITSPVTFLATSNAVIYAGAKPVFADIDADTANISVNTISKMISSRTKAIIVVHMGGLPADMPAIAKLAKKHGLKVIEDGCHALGAQYLGHRVGSCAHSDMTVFSFHPVKLITTGEGGCVTTPDEKLALTLKRLRTHGMVRDPHIAKKNGGWYYEMQSLGFNYRLTDIQCALGLSQLKKATWFLKERKKIAAKYNGEFALLGDRVQLPFAPNGYESAWHLYVLRARSSRPKHSRRKLYEYLQSQGIQAQVHYIPVYRQPFYQKAFGLHASGYPQAENYYREALSLPIFPGLTRVSQNKVVKTVRDFFNK